MRHIYESILNHPRMYILWRKLPKFDLAIEMALAFVDDTEAAKK